MILRNSISILFILLLSAVCSFAQSKSEKKRIKSEIEEMFVKDQQYRWMIMYGELDEQKLAELKSLEMTDKVKRMRDVVANKVGISKAEKDSLWVLQHKIDAVNFEKLASIIKTSGYPAYADQEKVSVILLHNSAAVMKGDFQEVLKQEVKNKHMEGIEYALIYDRVQMENGQPELYYVTEHFDDKGVATIGTPVDIDATNAARKEIGLKSIKK